MEKQKACDLSIAIIYVEIKCRMSSFREEPEGPEAAANKKVAKEPEEAGASEALEGREGRMEYGRVMTRLSLDRGVEIGR